jgi:membrane-bound lytic murein transglycosylase A
MPWPGVVKCYLIYSESSGPPGSLSRLTGSLSSPFWRPENIVHQTINTKISKAPKASNKSNTMSVFSWISRTATIITAALVLVSCAGVSTPTPEVTVDLPSATPSPLAGVVVVPDAGVGLPVLTLGKSRWVAVPWSALPGFEDDALFEAWNAWLKSCERPGPEFAPLCADVRRLSLGSGVEQRDWMKSRLQPYRVESLQGGADGLLTSYYEPVLQASRQPDEVYRVPLYRLPAGFGKRKPWYTRQEIDTLPEAQAALKGREIAWLADPIDALLLHIQGSGRLRFTESDGTQRMVRVAFAGSNDQSYRSVNQWLLEQGVTKINPWPDATKAWVAQNPQRLSQLLWSNPRYIFFREESLNDSDAADGPRGAQGVALTAGRSIAVDKTSIPYGTPVWLASRGPAADLNKLVIAQDTGSAIVGAVRADYFAGTGEQAGKLASAINQPLRLWVLWPK